MKCTHRGENNKTCRANAMNGSGFCYFHNPAIPKEEKTRARSEGGSKNAITVIQPLPKLEIKKTGDIISLLCDTIARVRQGELDVKIGNCLSGLSGQLIRAYEISNLENRIEEIEDFILKKQGNTCGR